MNANELEQYRQEIISEHQAEIAAIDRLIARERNKLGESVNGSLGVVTITRKRGRPIGRRSTASVVRDAVKHMDRPFTREQISKYIEDNHGPDISNRTVSVELWKLAQAKEIRTVQEGRGRIPAEYEK